jgi:D-arginine dehydrogenase
VTDFVVVGGGMAGASAAAHLAPHGSVVLLETEPTMAFHTTGRSAALFIVNYGTQGSRPFAAASQAFLENPPEKSIDAPLLSDRGLLWIADATKITKLDEISAGTGARLLDPGEAIELVPALRPERVAGAVHEPKARDIDVAALHQAYVRIARSHGAEIRTGSPVTAIQRDGTGWTVTTGHEMISCGAVINASGAWGDETAQLAGVAPIGLQPMRRTAFMVPGSYAYHHWPMVAEADQHFYFKPDGVQFLCSLAEEEPCHPCDPKPRMEDVALAIERINDFTTLRIRAVNSQWTGLRTFAPDRNLVIGEDPGAPGFFWLVGQGGIGIQTSPAYGSLLASLATGTPVPEHLVAAGVDPSASDPARFRV